MITQSDLQQLDGADVYATDGGKIGSAGQVYLDNETGNPEWVTVKTGLFGTKESFVPLDNAKLTGDRLEIPFDKDRVKGAPQIDTDGELSPSDEDQLYTYYGIGSTGGRIDTATDTRNSAVDTGYTETSAGRDTTGTESDNAMTRSEERLVAGTRTEQAGTARLRKHVVTEQQSVTVPVQHYTIEE